MTAPSNERVTLSVDGGIADVRLNRADKMNALDPAMFEGIVAMIEVLAGRRDVRCVVLSGEGRGFCAGLDMASMASGPATDLAERRFGVANLAQQVAWGWRALPMPVIAAVHGVAFGGGFQIIAGADVRVARADTRFAIREAHWGLVPDMAGPTLWRSLVRDDVLRELTYTARELDGVEAHARGFVTRLAEEPLAEAMALAKVIAGRSPDAVRGAKRLYNLAADADAAAVLAAETEEQLRVIRTPDQMEQVRANLEKRPPVFKE